MGSHQQKPYGPKLMPPSCSLKTYGSFWIQGIRISQYAGCTILLSRKYHLGRISMVQYTLLYPSAVDTAFLSTSILSLGPNILLFRFPSYGASGHGNRRRAMLSLGQALAVGGLVGDVFFRTLPKGFTKYLGGNHGGEQDPHHDHHHGGGYVDYCVILGFSALLVQDIGVCSLEEKSGGEHARPHRSTGRREGGEYNRKGVAIRKKDGKQPWQRFLSSAVLLNLLGDSMHNFTDGLAIGASFSITEIPQSHLYSSFISWTTFSLSKSRGGLASISVLLHKIPHELGDFARMVRAGLTRNMAISTQFITFSAAFLLGLHLVYFWGRLSKDQGMVFCYPFIVGGQWNVY